MSRRTEDKQEKKRLEEIINKALEALQDGANEDKLIKYVEVPLDDQKALVAIGKCKGTSRPFPCVYIEYAGRGYTFSAYQLGVLTRILGALSDEEYASLGVFVDQSRGQRARRSRKVEEGE